MVFRISADNHARAPRTLFHERYEVTRTSALLNGHPSRPNKNLTVRDAVVSVGNFATGEGAEVKNVPAST